MKNLFRSTPDLEYADYTTSHEGKGSDYQDRFARLPGRAMMWRLEQQAIQQLIGGASPSSVLDFATGTGRVARALRRVAPDAQITGVDVSESMLEVAKSKSADGIKFIQADGRKLADVIERQTFDLATAFRFFPNAEPNLRETIADQLTEVLSPSGQILVNNHRNFWSPSYIIDRVRSGSRAPGMLNRDIINLFVKRGLRLKGSISLGVWPQGEERAAFLPWNAAEKLEAFTAMSFGARHTAGYNTLFLFSA